MGRLKLLIGLACAVMALASAVSSASASWESSQTQGVVNVLDFGKLIIGAEAAVITCPASEVESQWHIQVKGQIKQQQAPATKGPNLNLQVKNWGKCEATVGGIKGLKTEIKACGLEIVQQQNKVGNGGISTSCLIKIGAEGKESLCEIQLPAGMETSAESGKGINVGLEPVGLENEGKNQADVIDMDSKGLGEASGEGILALSVGKNALCPLAKVSETSKFVGLQLEELGLKAAPPFFSSAGNVTFYVKTSNTLEQEFIVTGAVVKCAEEEGKTTTNLTSPTSLVPMELTFKNCAYAKTSPAELLTVNNFTCKLLFLGRLALNFESSCVMEVIKSMVLNCTITFTSALANADRNPVIYGTIPGVPKTVAVGSTVAGVTYTSTAGVCPAGSNNGQFIALSTWKGYNVGNTQIDLEY